MTPYKVVGRHREIVLQPPWRNGKPLTIAKKTVYVTEKDFNRYSPELILRWIRFYDVEVYKFIDDKWKLTKTIEGPR